MKGTLQERMLPSPINGGFKMDGYWVWCGSVVIGEDGKYHMFASRWDKSTPMHPGWLLRSEVVRAVSDTPEGPFTFEEVVLPARGAQYWDGRMTHNPHIKKIGDTYVLYYIGTTHPFADDVPDEYKVIVARSNKRIGIATSKSVFGPWERPDRPTLDVRPDRFDSFLTSNPAPCVLDDGSIYLMYKSRAYLPKPYDRPLQSGMMLGMARADAFGKPHIHLTDEPIFDSSANLEDPFIWHDADGFNMIAKDMVGNICGERYGGVHALSDDGLHWSIRKNVVFYSRSVLWNDGTIRHMGNMERPFILFHGDKPTHIYFATSDSTDGNSFINAKNTWNMVIPLR